MATKTTSKKTSVASTEKFNKFVGILYQFKQVEGTEHRICWFETLNADGTKTIKFPALLTDNTRYLAGYIKNHTVLEVTVKELEPVEGKRRFEIVSMMSEVERINYNTLVAYAEKTKA